MGELTAAPTRRVRFDVFEIDLEARELYRNGERVVIQDKPMRLLEALVRRAGSLVSREDLYAALWPGVQHLDFEANLNAAVRKLRKVLAPEPEWIETVPGRGYRWKGPATSALPATSAGPAAHRLAAPRVWVLAAATFAVIVALVATIAVRSTGDPINSPLRLAIMPFELATQNPEEQAQLARISETLLVGLARGWEPALQVIGPRSTAPFAALPFPDFERLGDELAIDYVVNGRWLEDERGRVLIVELIRLSDQDHSWVNAFEKDEEAATIVAVARSGIADSLGLRPRSDAAP